MSYRDIIKRNEQLIDNVFDMQDDIVELAGENEMLNEENEVIYKDNINLNNENYEMKDGIEELHRNSRRRYGGFRTRRMDDNMNNNTNGNVNGNVNGNANINNSCGFEVQKEEEKPTCPLQPKKEKVDRVAFSLYTSERTKNILLFASLIGLILLLGLGITPGMSMNYEVLLDLYLACFFNLFNMSILVTIGFILRQLWKKVNR